MDKYCPDLTIKEFRLLNKELSKEKHILNEKQYCNFSDHFIIKLLNVELVDKFLKEIIKINNNDNINMRNKIANVKLLLISSNSFNGDISRISCLTNLKELFIEFNEFENEIDFSRLNELRKIDLILNNFDKNIDNVINLNNLKNIKFEGEIFNQTINFQKTNKIKFLSIICHNFDSNIDSFENLIHVKELYFECEVFNKSIVPFDKMLSLEELHFRCNYFYQKIELNLKNLRSLTLMIPLKIDDKIELNTSNLKTLILKFESDQISEGKFIVLNNLFDNLINLESLDLHSIEFNERINNIFSKLTKLNILKINFRSFCKELCFNGLVNLKELYFCSWSFTNKIDFKFDNLKNLEILDLSFSLFNENIDNPINCPELKEFYFKLRSFKKPLKNCFEKLTKLKKLTIEVDILKELNFSQLSSTINCLSLKFNSTNEDLSKLASLVNLNFLSINGGNFNQKMDLSELTKLDYLMIRSNNFDNEIIYCENLRHLELILPKFNQNIAFGKNLTTLTFRCNLYDKMLPNFYNYKKVNFKSKFKNIFFLPFPHNS